MATALFATTSYFKQSTIVDENVDDKIIAVVIEDMQDLRIHEILGTDLYEDLQTKVIAGTIAGDDKTLLDSYVFPTLKYYVVSELSFDLMIRIRNKGVQKLGSENAQSVSFSEAQSTSSRYEDKAEEMAQRMIDYLCENEALFPLYSENTTQDKIKPLTTAATTSIYLGGRTRKRKLSAEQRYG